MRWQGGRESENVEDRRGMRGPVMVGGGVTPLVLLLLVWALGGDPLALLQQLNQGPPGGPAAPFNPGAPGADAGIDDEAKQFVSVVLADTEDVWNAQFRRIGQTYHDPKLVLF